MGFWWIQKIQTKEYIVETMGFPLIPYTDRIFNNGAYGRDGRGLCIFPCNSLKGTSNCLAEFQNLLKLSLKFSWFFFMI